MAIPPYPRHNFMKPKMICDGCKESLKEKMEIGDSIYVISDSVGGLSVMDHNNCPNDIVFCEGCEEGNREQLKDNECWFDLELLDNGNSSKDFYEDYGELKKYIEGLNKK